VAQAVPAAVFQPPPIAAMRTSKPVAPHLQELRGLLRSSRGLRTAFVINEIFGTPRCRRPHHR
jgi:hypothetical protein